MTRYEKYLEFMGMTEDMLLTPIDALAVMEKEELMSILGIGNKIADSITSYFDNPSNLDVIKKLKEIGVLPKNYRRVDIEDKLDKYNDILVEKGKYIAHSYLMEATKDIRKSVSIRQ